MEGRSPTRWRRRKEARPDEILAAALESFAATRLEDVAARAGISKGTLYLYFKGKEELFEAVVRATLLPNLARLEALAASFEGPSALDLKRADSKPRTTSRAQLHSAPWNATPQS
jgi:AcrR family transcriptional regulator